MILDFELVKSFYHDLPSKISSIRKNVKHPLTLSEKILYCHLFGENVTKYKRGEDYVEFLPDRIAMQDATAQMAVLQFMMAGKDSTAVPVSVHCDHLIVAKTGAEQDLHDAQITNKEVYDFLKSACNRYGMDFWNPGAGIIHQIVLENYAFPGGMMIGTDSHTPTAGGMGMIAIGVGGADAVDSMVGMGWELKFPQVTGIKLTGRLNGWASAKDVILKITGMLTVKGGTGSVIEYFGEGASTLTCTGKATICNMGAETGATCSLFTFDNSMVDYLSATGRKDVAEIALLNKSHLEADPEVYADPSRYYDQFIEINLSELEPYINGPFTPDLATPLSRMKEEAKKNGWPVDVEVGLIGSCTNSSYEDLSRAASVVSNAIELKLSPKADFKITPGSEQVKAVAGRDGFLDTFRKIGAEVFANACGPCIGQWEREGSDKRKVNAIIHSFNRNFSKRTDGNPNTYGFVASPEIVTAIAIAGKLTFNPLKDTLVNSEGAPVMLAEPKGINFPPDGFSEGKGYQKPDKSSAEVIISPSSNRLQRLEPFPAWDGKEILNVPLLIKVKGKCTTDHISMAGYWLKFRGHLQNISENYMIGAVNSFNDETNKVFNQLTGEYDLVPRTAREYREAGSGSVVVGEENFGEGSSREHAAMEARFLGVRAIIVKSFARIHETNLKKQGVLTLTFVNRDDYMKVLENDRIDIRGFSEFSEGSRFTVILRHALGEEESIQASHSYNEQQIEWFKAGSALNIIRKKRYDTRKN
jgi:aconitate hydratase